MEATAVTRANHGYSRYTAIDFTSMPIHYCYWGLSLIAIMNALPTNLNDRPNARCVTRVEMNVWCKEAFGKLVAFSKQLEIAVVIVAQVELDWNVFSAEIRACCDWPIVALTDRPCLEPNTLYLAKETKFNGESAALLQLSNELLRNQEERRRDNTKVFDCYEERQQINRALTEDKSDWEHLLKCTQIATILLDEDFIIRRFTPAATKIYCLNDTDIGRPIKDIRAWIDNMPPLPSQADVQQAGVIEHTVGTQAGPSFIRRVLPYLLPNGNYAGIVVTFIDFADCVAIQRSLQTHKRQLHMITNAIPTMIAYVDRHRQYRFVNTAYCDAFGRKPAELIGKAVQTEVGDTTYGQLAPYLDLAFQGKRVNFELSLPIGEPQETRFKEANYVPDINPDGHVVGCYVFVYDITERQTLSLATADREADLRRTIDHMIGFVGLLDIDGTLREVNELAISAAGVSRDEVIGKKFWDCYWWNYDEAIVAQLQEAITLAAAGQTLRYDVRIRTKDDARSTIDFMLAPIRDCNGQVTHIIPSAMDISERIKAEDAYRQTVCAIRDNEERLAMALRAGGMAAWEWNPHESIWTEKLYEMLGISKDKVASLKTFLKRVHPADLPKLKHAWKQALINRTACEVELRITQPDGEVRWLVGIGEFAVDGQGKVVRVFGLSWDSTLEHVAAEKLRESERRAQQANLAKSEFIANMSHEIRTPMTAVLGYTELLAASEVDAGKLEYLRTIKRNGHFLLELINDILDLSKIEAGKMEIDRHPFDLQEIVVDVQSMMELRARACQLDFELKYLTPVPAIIHSDGKKLKQILVNLVGNAIKFTDRGGVQLWISFESHSARMLRFDVLDTGIGMNAEKQATLFQPFVQGDASVTRKYGGTGLGLTISRRLAKMLGGRIEVQSELGKGSCFTCTIDAGPVVDTELMVPCPEVNSASIGNWPSHDQLNCRVLVVDDRRDVRYLTKHFLTKAGAEVELAEDGLHALELAAKAASGEVGGIDLILLDMQMPRLDGYKTARALRQCGFDKPIIALTADAMHGDMSRCIECGCDSYLSKPIDGPTLLKVVAEHTRPTTNP